MKTIESFVASFTGLMKTYITKDGRRLVFKQGTRIEKGRSYILELDEKGQGKLFPLQAGG